MSSFYKTSINCNFMLETLDCMLEKSHKYVSCASCSARKDSLFSNHCDHELDELDESKSCNYYKKNQPLFIEGSFPRGVFCLNGGKVKVYKNNLQGKEYILYISKPGDFLGYRALLSEEFYAASATVLEDAKICFIQKEDFFEVLQKIFNRQIAHRSSRLHSSTTNMWQQNRIW